MKHHDQLYITVSGKRHLPEIISILIINVLNDFIVSVNPLFGDFVTYIPIMFHTGQNWEGEGGNQGGKVRMGEKMRDVHPPTL